MFSLRDFVLKGLQDAIGKQSDYWVILNASSWYTKGVLLDEDMLDLQTTIDSKNTPNTESLGEE